MNCIHLHGVDSSNWESNRLQMHSPVRRLHEIKIAWFLIVLTWVSSDGLPMPACHSSELMASMFWARALGLISSVLFRTCEVLTTGITFYLIGISMHVAKLVKIVRMKVNEIMQEFPGLDGWGASGCSMRRCFISTNGKPCLHARGLFTELYHRISEQSRSCNDTPWYRGSIVQF